MKNNCLLLLALFAPLIMRAGIRVVEPSVKTPTRFAIVIDRTSYDKVRPAADAYREAVEKDGLGTYLLVVENETPDRIRERIVRLSGEKSPLEGVVLIGDIPIPMIRDAQHLTSAFKMDQSRDWKETSVPSDRYYDDFDLQFDFIRQDSLRPLYYYYSLSPRSPQHIDSDIYSARIKAPERPGQDKYRLLEKFLRKAAAAHAVSNPLDSLFVFRGHGYYSDDPTAWADEQRTLREQLPDLFLPGHRIRFTDYDTYFPLKAHLLEEIQRPGTDVVLGHHHGAPNMQYISGNKEIVGFADAVGLIRMWLRGQMSRSKDTSKTKAEWMARLGFPEAWFVRSDSLRIADSLYKRSLNIHTDDIYGCRPAARFIMHDACYNGSFHLDDYVAGAYLFGDGLTVAAQGNTVNAIQDKWPDRLIGLLAAGVRIGQWGRHTHYLETHLLGDPTYRFANTADPGLNLGKAIVLRTEDNAFWLKLTEHPLPDVQALALQRLYANNYPGIVPLLKKRFSESPYGAVRMEAYCLLKEKSDADYREVLVQGLGDNYELIRRMCMQDIGECGDDSLIPVHVKAMQEERISPRTNFYGHDICNLFDPVKLKAEIERQWEGKEQLWPVTYAEKASLMETIDRYEEYVKTDLETMADPNKPLKERQEGIRTLRNYHYHRYVPRYIAFARDTSQPEELRVAMVEALGWFGQSYQREKILDLCDDLIRNGGNSRVADEARKSKSRLNGE